MSETTKNIIIFLVVGVALVAVYIFFIKKSPSDSASLISSTGPVEAITQGANTNSAISQDFLTLLLSVKKINLNDAIFSDVAFTSLDGSNSITLVPDGTEGRVNPFAPIGTDIVVPLITPPVSPLLTPPAN